MHADEVPTSALLVRRLLAAQFPDWATLPITPVSSSGTDNALYRLGGDKVVRLPRIGWAAADVAKEQAWLPGLASQLPLAVPTPLALGAPGEGYPWPWSVYNWLEGKNPQLDTLEHPQRFTTDLAGFINALHKVETAGGPPAGRGVPLAERDEATRQALAALTGRVDVGAAAAAWDAALNAPPWRGAPVWVHGDLQAGNLLVKDGRLSAVIDFGGLGVGDPACDTIVAWNFLSAGLRAVFKQALALDEATWARGRGWALSVALIALPYYWDSNPYLADTARHAIREVLTEYGAGV